MLKEIYGELGFLEGDGSVFKPDMTTATGKMRMFVKPDKPRSFTIILELAEDFNCLVISGEHVAPMVSGTEL